MKTKYIFGTLVLGAICIFSAIHPERYHISIPVMFFILFVSSIIIGLTDNQKIIEVTDPSLSNVVKLHNLMIKHKDIFDGGLCAFTTELCTNNFINSDSFMALIDFIDHNRPDSDIYIALKIPDRTGKPYYFEPDDFDIRIKWLKYLIKNKHLVNS